MDTMDTNIIKDYDIYVDFGYGDKFMATGFNIDNINKKIIINCNNHSLDWVKLNISHPIKSFKYHGKK